MVNFLMLRCLKWTTWSCPLRDWLEFLSVASPLSLRLGNTHIFKAALTMLPCDWLCIKKRISGVISLKLEHRNGTSEGWKCHRHVRKWRMDSVGGKDLPLARRLTKGWEWIWYASHRSKFEWDEKVVKHRSHILVFWEDP